MRNARLLCAAAGVILVAQASLAEQLSLTSPDGSIELEVNVADHVSYSVLYKSEVIIGASPLSLTVNDGNILGCNSQLLGYETRMVDDRIYPVIREKRRVISDNCRELKITFKEDFGLIFRCYNDAVAYRFFTAMPGRTKVVSEHVCFRFPKDAIAYFAALECKPEQQPDCFHTSYELPYQTPRLSEISLNQVGCLPVLVTPDKGPKLAITEADVEDYPGMYLAGSDGNVPSLHSVFPAYPLTEQITGGHFPSSIVTQRADYIADTNGTRDYPWRIIVVAGQDGLLAETDVVYRLGGRSRIADANWIKPGKSTSEWLIDNNIYGVDFRAGYNTDTYKFYIDFCSRFGVEYVLFDAGWSDVKDLFRMTPAMDMDFLIGYAAEKGVGVVLWTLADTLDRQMSEALDKFEKWGVKGIMVDFMNRDDQKMVNFYYRVAEEAARRHIFVDFHGAYKPDGLSAKYPNAITREAFMALEYNKWSDALTPEHEMQMAFIRLLAGPMDYEPGCMKNAQKHYFHPINTIPHSQGTRMHQVAMFIIYESPYAKMGGNPSDYLREPELTSFIARTPTVWDETRVLDAKVADYIVMLRQAANGDFYIGAMTDWSPRRLEASLSFLPDGKFSAEIFQDGANADRYAEDYRQITRTVTRYDKLQINLAPGGGFAARIWR